MKLGKREDIVQRLWSFTNAACIDPVFRRELRYSPRLALSRHGLAWEHEVPEQLPIRHYEISLNFEESLLFGIPDSPASFPKWPNRTENKLLMAGCKPMVLEHGSEKDMTGLAQCLSRQGFTALLSPYEFQPATDQVKSGYSNLATNQRPARPGSGQWRSLVVGRETERVQLAWLCMLFGWDNFLGQLLGYPKCCTAAFTRRWPEARDRHSGEVCNLMLRDSSSAWIGSFGWQTNVFGRYLGLETIQHFPCDWNCAATVQMAKRNRSLLDIFWPGDTAALEALAAPVLYTENSGVAIFPGSRVTADGGDIQMMFDPHNMLVTDPDGPMANRLRDSAGRLRVNGSKISAGRSSIAGWLIDFSGKPGAATPLPTTASTSTSEKLYEILLPTQSRVS